MRIIIIIIFIFVCQITAIASEVTDYIDSYTNYFNNESYKAFSGVIKGTATISDIEKQFILDREISDELNSTFIYTDLKNCIDIALEENYDIKIQNQYKRQSYWQYRNSQFQLLQSGFRRGGASRHQDAFSHRSFRHLQQTAPLSSHARRLRRALRTLGVLRP